MAHENQQSPSGQGDGEWQPTVVVNGILRVPDVHDVNMYALSIADQTLVLRLTYEGELSELKVPNVNRLYVDGFAEGNTIFEIGLNYGDRSKILRVVSGLSGPFGTEKFAQEHQGENAVMTLGSSYGAEMVCTGRWAPEDVVWRACKA